MKIELLELLTKIEKFVEQNPNANEIFIPFFSSKEEVSPYVPLMESLTESEVLFLAVEAKGNQAILQMIWCFVESPIEDYILNCADKYEAFNLMLLDGYVNQVIKQYEVYYDALKYNKISKSSI